MTSELPASPQIQAPGETPAEVQQSAVVPALAQAQPEGNRARSAARRRVARRRVRLSKAAFTAVAAILAIAFLLPFIYAISQSLSDPAAAATPGGGPSGPPAGAPLYPYTQKSYECTDSKLCTFQNGGVDSAGNFVPYGDPVDVSKGPNPKLLVYAVPGHGDLALLQVNDPYGSGLPCQFIDPQTNKRVAVVIDANTLVPAWEFHVTTDSFTSALDWANGLTQAAPGGFLRWMLNSTVIAGASAIGAVLSAILVAYGFARFRFRGRDLLFMVLIASVLIPYQVTLIPQFILYHTMGLDATFLPLILPNFFGNAFYIFLLRQYFMTLPRELDEAAMVDGAGHFRILTSIIIPQAWPAIVTVALLQFLFSWNDFIGPLIYLTSWSDLTPVSLGISYFQVSPSILEAGAIMSLAIPLVVALAAQRAFVSGIVIARVEK